MSTIAKAFVNGVNLPGSLAATNANFTVGCVAGGTLPVAGSGAYKVQQTAFDFNNAMAASGASGYTTATGCISSLNIPQPLSSAPYVNSAGQSFTAFAQPGIGGFPNLLSPDGFNTGGGAAVSLPLRQYNGAQTRLAPETAINWSIGAQYTPSNFLRGLDIQATYWIIKINNLLTAFTNPTGTRFADPTLGFSYAVPSELGCPDLPNPVRPSIPIPANLVPSACPQWINAISGILANPKATVLLDAKTLIWWINDGSEFNLGWVKRDGIDFNVSYSWDMGDIGAFNTGIVGSLDLHNYSNVNPTSSASLITDQFHTTVGSGSVQSNGVTTFPLFRYRGRLGWSNGPWNITGFMDYQSHYFHTFSAPANVNGNFCTSTAWGAGAGGTFPCAQNNWQAIVPSWITFDVSVGYDTGDIPTNAYLKNVGIQLVIQNLMDKHDDMMYKGSTAAGPPTTINPYRPNFGRQISLILTKSW